jgi:hypothetical protein
MLAALPTVNVRGVLLLPPGGGERCYRWPVSELDRRFDGEPTGSLGVCRLAICCYNPRNCRQTSAEPGGRCKGSRVSG